MSSRKLFLALLGGAVLAVAAIGAATSQGASAPPDGSNDALTAARFSITIDGVEIAVFSELAGISSGYETSALELSARRLAVPGKRMPPTVTLKRGLNNSMEIQAWHEQALSDPLAARKNATLVIYNTAGAPIARYHLENAWPSKLEAGALSAGASQVLLETVTIVSENLQRVAP
jgi:phage tail-like protein